MYSDENKNKVLRLIRDGEKVATIAKMTSISISTLYRWEKESAKIHLIIKENILIGKLINRFQEEWRVDKNKADNIMKKITELIDECFKLDPNNIYTFGYAIKAAKLRKNFPEAIKLLKRRLELEPNNVIAIQELENLEQMQNEEKFRQEEFEKAKFLTTYKRLRNNGDIEELEILLRKRILEYPDDLISQNRLASVLLDKLSHDPNKPSLISEIKNILLKLHELEPNNLTVKSNLIRLDKLCCNEQSMEAMLRELIAADSRNYKAKSQLAQLLINKYKGEAQNHELQECILDEATSLASQVLQEFPNNRYALGQLREIARLNRDLDTQEALVRRAIELDPNNTRLKTNLAGTKIEQCIQKVLKDGAIAEYDPSLMEAKQILLKIFESEPRNLYAITYLIRIAKLQTHIREVINLLKLKISIDPTDIQAQKDLHTLEEKVRLKNDKKTLDIESEKNNSTGQVSINNATSSSIESTNPTDTQEKVKFNILYNALMEALDKVWNRQLVSEILNKMLADKSVSDNDRKRIRVMIEKAKSNKEKTRFALREQATVLSKKLY